MRIKIINGPNLNLLGKREPLLYGSEDFQSVLHDLRANFAEIEIAYVQTHSETDMVSALHDSDGVVGIVLNPAAFGHTSLAVGDAVAAIDVPVVEVHISNVYAREHFRQKSYVSKYAAGVLTGFGVVGYHMAISYFLRF